MTPDMLISEGRRLARPCNFLCAKGNGPVAAIWHDRDDAEIEATGHRCWITLDARFVPGLPKEISGFLTVFSDEEKCQGGRIEVQPVRPQRIGIELYAAEKAVLPPIDAVFARGSDAVGEWLVANKWQRDWGYNSNFSDRGIVEAYEGQWFKEHPLYRDDDTYAVLGGWHSTWPDDDWHQMIDEQLLVLTIRDSEPWIEGWRMRSGQLAVVQRIT